MTTEVLGSTDANATAAPWIPDDEPFGARLALVRQRMGWGNVSAAALACGIPVETWRTWERDNVRPQDVVERARKIALRTGCDLDWLIRGPAKSGGHSNYYAVAVKGPKDNRPSGRPQTGSSSQEVRRPARRHDATSMAHTRRAA